ncbi:HXXEE domain-containing protein [Streptomyces sp. NPDC018045]|uniref:HXXEE domain-containing protein n=1 Tax=Streptomyces sp. NPDC018045 TaxID=3365037 RepID=UPI0037B23BF7
MSKTSQDLSPAVTFGLLAAWAVHDAEEVAFGPRWIRQSLPELRKRFPGAPERLWNALENVDQREFTLAVGAMAAIVATASAHGHRTGGRSAFFQGAVDGFGLHGLVHLAQAAAVRGYTPGSVTSPLIVIPYALWARGRLRRAGRIRPTDLRGTVSGLVTAGAATALSHIVARRLIRR